MDMINYGSHFISGHNVKDIIKINNISAFV